MVIIFVVNVFLNVCFYVLIRFLAVIIFRG